MLDEDHGARTDEEEGRDFLVGLALGNQLEDLAFAMREKLVPGEIR